VVAGRESGAFTTNSLGAAPVSRLDDLAIPIDTELMKTVTQALPVHPLGPDLSNQSVIHRSPDFEPGPGISAALAGISEGRNSRP